MHRKVIKISSGGVHNICIVEPQPCSLVEDLYKEFMNGLYTDVVFTGFCQTYDNEASAAQALLNNKDNESNNNLNSSQHSYSDEDMRDGSVSGQDINL